MYIQLDGQILYYEKSGDGEPLILLHGNGEDHHIFDELVKSVSNKYTVYAIDTRGHGQSATSKEYHYSDFAKDLNLFISTLSIEIPTVLGFSDGAITAMLALLMKSDMGEHGGILNAKKMILCGGNLKPDGIKFSERSKIKKDYNKTKNPLTKLMLDEPNINPSDLGKFSMPIYVFAGSRDLIKESETKKIASAFPNATMNILSGEDHGSYVIHSDYLKSYL